MVAGFQVHISNTIVSQFTVYAQKFQNKPFSTELLKAMSIV